MSDKNFLISFNRIKRVGILIAVSLLLFGFIFYLKYESILDVNFKITDLNSNLINSELARNTENAYNKECKAWRDAPSLSIMCRAYSGSILEYYNVFLVGYHLFWPKNQWTNSDLVVVLDDESELDHRMGSVLANLPPYPKVYYEKMPSEQTFCAQDRRIGYSRQQYSNFYSDLYSDKDFIGIVDSDSIFSTMVIPETLFVKGKPRIYG
jgi:hypothetical protein